MTIYYVMAVIVVLIVGFVFYCRYENSKFCIKEYELICKKLKKPLTLCVLSDLHNYSYGNDNEKLIAAIDSIRPDYVISSGDMIEGAKVAPKTAATVDFLKKIVQKYHFIYGCGNHEYKLLNHEKSYDETADAYENALEDASKYLLRSYGKDKSEEIFPLDNKNIVLEDYNAVVYGLNLETEYFKKITLNEVDEGHIIELVGRPSENALSILIGHNPDQFEAYVKWGADIVLAGHIHGGMIAFPGGRGLVSPRFLPFPKYYSGIYTKKNTNMIVSRGLGNHTIHIRIFNRAEILKVRLIPEK